MVDTARAAGIAPRRRDAILEAVAFAAERLLLAADWEDAADEVLSRLGVAAGVSRAYVVENGSDPAGRLTSTWLVEWCEPGIERITDDPRFRTAAWIESGFGRWVELLGRGEAVIGHVAEFPRPERDVLESHGVISLASLPIWVSGRWWGSIGFDDCHGRRDWTGSELEALRAAAGVLGAAIQRQRSDRRLRAAEERWRHVVELIPAVTYTDIPGDDGVRMGFVSPQIERALGYPPQRFVENPGFWFELMHPDDLRRLGDAGAFEAGDIAPFDEEYRMRAADGTYRWFHDTSTPVFRDDATVDYFLGFMTDITQRRDAEGQLREAEERYRAVVEHIPAVVYTESPDGDAERFYISPQVLELFGYSAEEWRWTPDFWRDRIHPDDRDTVLEVDDHSNETREPYSLDYRFRHRDGHWVWIRDEATFVPDPRGDGFWQGFMLDISERKQAQEDLERALEVEREAARRLRALDEMKNTFLQAVSHDLRTPLAAILGLAITLERGDVRLDEGDARDLAYRIAGNARRLDRLVTNLLDLDRLARGIVTPKLEPADVGALVRRVMSESELVSGSRVHADLATVVVPLDGAKVERIVENLLANTVRHTPEKAMIWLRVRDEPGGVLIAVEDDGPGVPADLREAIFEPFRQGPDAPQHSPGVGVGLTLVRQFAELHGGRAWVEERDGGGASFRVFLPARPPGEPVGEPETEALPTQKG